MAKAMYIGVRPALPNGYTPIEYIESTGIQYINTDYKPNHNTRVVLDASVTLPTSGEANAYLFGASSSGKFALYVTSSGRVTYTYANTTSGITDISGNTRYIFDCDKKVCTVNGVSKTMGTSVTFTNTSDLLLYRQNVGGGDGWTKMKIYSCRIYDNGTLVRDFVPAISSVGLKGLYDLVSKSFHMNPEADAFIAGQNIDSVTKKVIKPYIGVNGVARKVKKVYIGDENGKARLVYTTS